MPESTPKTMRVYACFIDGEPHSRAFSHPEGSKSVLEIALNQKFHLWLEETAPGAYAAGRVRGIRFADLHGMMALRPFCASQAEP